MVLARLPSSSYRDKDLFYQYIDRGWRYKRYDMSDPTRQFAEILGTFRLVLGKQGIVKSEGLKMKQRMPVIL